MSEFKPQYETLQPLETQLERAVVSDQDKEKAQEDWENRFDNDRYQEILNAEAMEAPDDVIKNHKKHQDTLNENQTKATEFK